MLKRFETPMPPFAKYFKEADEDEKDNVTVTVAPRKNRGTDYNDDANTVTVKPRENRGTDYGQDDTPEEDTNEEDEQDTEGEDTTQNSPDTGDGETDYSEDDGGAEEDENAGADEGADGDEEPDGPDTGDGGTDYSSDDGEDTENDSENSEEDGENEESPEEKIEATKKYHMYKRFMHLYNLIEMFIEKTRSIVKADAYQNTVIKTVSNNLSDLHDNMFDYMTIKYKSSSYVQILIYFETAISIIRLNFELLKNNKINLKQ